MSGANDRTGVGAGSAEWGTPGDLFGRLHSRFRFDFDAFAAHDNHLVPLYATAGGVFKCEHDVGPGCSRLMQYKAQESLLDGLEFPWTGRRVFMNPPYSRGLIEQCIAKAYEERDRAELIVALLPAATETRWFQQFILPHCHIDWLPRRVHYIDPETKRPGGSPPSGAVIAVFKTDLQRKEVAAEQ